MALAQYIDNLNLFPSEINLDLNLINKELKQYNVNLTNVNVKSYDDSKGIISLVINGTYEYNNETKNIPADFVINITNLSKKNEKFHSLEIKPNLNLLIEQNLLWSNNKNFEQRIWDELFIQSTIKNQNNKTFNLNDSLFKIEVERTNNLKIRVYLNDNKYKKLEDGKVENLKILALSKEVNLKDIENLFSKKNFLQAYFKYVKLVSEDSRDYIFKDKENYFASGFSQGFEDTNEAYTSGYLDASKLPEYDLFKNNGEKVMLKTKYGYDDEKGSAFLSYYLYFDDGSYEKLITDENHFEIDGFRQIDVTKNDMFSIVAKDKLLDLAESAKKFKYVLQDLKNKGAANYECIDQNILKTVFNSKITQRFLYQEDNNLKAENIANFDLKYFGNSVKNELNDSLLSNDDFNKIKLEEAYAEITKISLKKEETNKYIFNIHFNLTITIKKGWNYNLASHNLTFENIILPINVQK